MSQSVFFFVLSDHMNLFKDVESGKSEFQHEFKLTLIGRLGYTIVPIYQSWLLTFNIFAFHLMPALRKAMEQKGFMQKQKNIIACYDKTASNYADKFIDELSKKHLDRILLTSFANENINAGKLIDLGCGPGQTTKFLSDCGVTDIIGVDISPQMVSVAKSIHPQLEFDIADILNLKYPDKSFGSAVAFYSIVHFDYEQIEIAFKEIKRVLKEKGQLLFSFHIGNSTMHFDNFLDHEVDIVFYYFETSKIKNLLMETGFEIVDIIERRPYLDVEHQSERAYIWAKTNNG